MKLDNNILDTLIVFLPLLFVLLYTVLAPWWKNLVSRAVCILMASISLVPVAKIVALLLDIPTRGVHDAAYTWMQVGFKIPVVIGVGYCIWVLIRLQRARAAGKIEDLKD